MVLRIPNRAARQLWLTTQGLSAAPTGALDLGQMIRDLGFVQLDTIQVVARAHHHILWTRNQNYRESMFDHHMSQERGVFEHFTHDASVIPMEFLPYWQRQFRRKVEQIDKSNWFKSMSDAKGRQAIKDRIRAEGALSTHAFDTKVAGPKEMWARPPHKLALDYMWYKGELATCHRVNFTKFYDLGERIFPQHLLDATPDDADQLDWLCHAAINRLGVGTTGEIKDFWEAASAVEVKNWASSKSANDLINVEIQAADGSWTTSLAASDIEERLSNVSASTSRLRIINPFDPAVRDRKRLERLFGFEYRNEMFVPAAKRRWGYYVYPMLEGDRFIGRIELKADRAKNNLTVINIWLEDGINWTKARAGKLDQEITRFARFSDVTQIKWNCERPG